MSDDQPGIQLKGGALTRDPRLDRVVQFDERSKQFPMRTMFRPRPLRSRGWTYVQLDQGTEGACTGFSVSMEAAATPVPVKNVTNDVAREVYHRARQLDDYEGEDYEGSSVLGAMKAAVEKGWYKQYRWALGPGSEQAVQDIAQAIAYHGPVVMGSNWYEGMYEANSDGYLTVTGQVMGGHAWLVSRFSLPRKAFWTPNSWGGSGQGWISWGDMVKLMHNDGEACIPAGRRRGNA